MANESRISTESAPRTGRLLIVGVAGLTLLLVVGFAVAFGIRSHHDRQVKDQTDTAADEMAVVEVVPVRPTSKTYPLTLPGETAGLDESPLYARVDGYVHDWSVDIGDRVKQGQTLATIDTPELDQQFAAATAKAHASDAQIKVAESNLSIAKLTNDRWKGSPKGVVSEQEQQQKQADYDSAVAHLDEAKAQAELDQAEANRYATMQKFRLVTAPYDGMITDRHCDIGDLVTAGSSGSTTPLYAMARYETIRVFADVPQKAAGITAGLTAFVISDQYPGRKFQGRVTRSAMSFDRQTRTEKTEVDILNADLALKPEMAVQVTFDLSQQGLLEVPAAAILPKPGGLQVAVVDKNGKVDFRKVTVAKDNGDTVELATGVDRGDRVALNISTAIVQGQQVKVEESPGGPATAGKPGGAAGGD